VAAGVRRIEAVTGPGAYELVRALDQRVAQAAELLRTSPEHLAKRIEALLEEGRQREKQLEELLRRGSGGADRLEEHRVGETLVLVGDAPVEDREHIGMLMDAFRERHRQNAVQVLFTRGERGGIHVAVTDDLIARGVTASDLVNRIAAVSGGRGGGRPHFASAGAGDAARLPLARRKVPEIVGEALGDAGGG
jgi:alanyl-tRNA synthetase